MSVVAEIVAPIFALIMLGYLAARTGRISGPALSGMNDFVFWLATPALLFMSVTGAETLAVARVSLAYFGAIAVLYVLSLAISMRLLKQDLAASAVFALNVTFGNTVMMGIPLIAAAFGPEGVANLIALVAFHSIVLLPLTTILLEIGRNEGGRIGQTIAVSVRALLRNPVILGIMVAMAWRILEVPVPGVLRRFTELLGTAAPAIALYCLGASIAGFRDPSGWRESLWAGMLKLFALPLLVALAAGPVAGLSGVPYAVAVITAALPTGANAFVLARRYATLADRSATTVVWTTAASILTIGGLLVLLR